MRFRVAGHTFERARQRFPGWQPEADEIIAECELAFSAGRVSPQRPASLGSSCRLDTLYAWTPDGRRVYALRPTEREFIVVTCLSAETQSEQLAA